MIMGRLVKFYFCFHPASISLTVGSQRSAIEFGQNVEYR